jgi:HSP20 family protein
MSIIKRSPGKEVDAWRNKFPVPRMLGSFQHDMNRLFDGLFRGDVLDNGSFFTNTWSPAVDLSETKDAYQIQAELPGLKKEDVKVTIEENLVTIRGEKKSESEKKEANYHRVERSYGSFERTFSLPGAIKNKSIDAHFEEGVLTVTLPKTEEAKQKMIDVKVK